MPQTTTRYRTTTRLLWMKPQLTVRTVSTATGFYVFTVLACVATSAIITRLAWDHAEVDWLLQFIGLALIVAGIQPRGCLRSPWKPSTSLTVLGMCVCAVGTTRAFIWAFSVLGHPPPHYLQLRLIHTFLAGMVMPLTCSTTALTLAIRRHGLTVETCWAVCLAIVLTSDLFLVLVLCEVVLASVDSF